MKKKTALLLLAVMVLSCAACGSAPAETTAATEAVTEAPTEAPAETEAAAQAPDETAPAVAALEDGVYIVDVETDSSMFHVNSELNNKGTLTVQDGAMTVHMTLAGKGYTMLCLGSAEDAAKEGAAVIEYSEDTVNYSDGTTDIAYGFDLPVPVMDEAFAVATYGKKSAEWKNHTVTVSNPVPAAEAAVPALEDGVYTVDVETDSSMFHVNSELDGKGTLTVQDGAMTLHMTLAGKGFTMLCLGSAEDAAKEGAEVIDFTEDTVNYSDGTTDIAYGFDLPVPVLDEAFDVAAYGKKSAEWKNHTVTVSNPVPVTEG